MAINHPVLDAGPSSPRGRNKQLFIEEAGAIPPESYRTIDDEKNVTNVDQTPKRLGQFCHYRGGSGLSRRSSTTMYVVVEINGVLEWKEVRSELRLYDSATGEPWDPLAQLPGYR